MRRLVPFLESAWRRVSRPLDASALPVAGMPRAEQRPLVVAVVMGQAFMRLRYARLLSEVFDREGIVVLEGATGLDAVALRLGTPAPDAMLMDIHLPEMEGDDALREIRLREQAEGLARIPVSIVTAHFLMVQEILRREAAVPVITAGPLDVVPWPAAPPKVIGSICQLLGITDPSEWPPAGPA